MEKLMIKRGVGVSPVSSEFCSRSLKHFFLNKEKEKFTKISKNIWKIFPQFFDENKISIVQKNVNLIDLLPKQFQQIETLYLSNNNLTSLEGIEQFSNLKILTLVNNDVKIFFFF